MDDYFKQKHPYIEIDKKSDSPDEDKSIGDSSALKPVLQQMSLLQELQVDSEIIADRVTVS